MKNRTIVLLTILALVILFTATIASASFDASSTYRRAIKMRVGETIFVVCPASQIVAGTPFTLWRDGQTLLVQPETCRWGDD